MISRVITYFAGHGRVRRRRRRDVGRDAPVSLVLRAVPRLRGRGPSAPERAWAGQGRRAFAEEKLRSFKRTARCRSRKTRMCVGEGRARTQDLYHTGEIL